MTETNTTILIPDISGFTEFMTHTELSHSSHAINLLIDAMLQAVGEEYEVSEIEGDAVLLVRKGQAPSKKEILDTCLRIFNAFHFRRKWLQQYTICPCGACQQLGSLTLKFVVHHGPVSEIKLGRFITQTGTEIIIAHRLLKNSIDDHEYILLTEELLEQQTDKAEEVEMEWSKASEEYASIGKVDYHYTLLHEVKDKVPDPPLPPSSYEADDTSYIQIPINTSFMDAYMVIMNIPDRAQWMPDLQKVEQDSPDIFIGSIHRCTYEGYRAVVSPLRMTLSGDGILYAERYMVDEMNLSLVHEFVFKKTGEKSCTLSARFLNAGEFPLTEEVKEVLKEGLQKVMEDLKMYCEK